MIHEMISKPRYLPAIFSIQIYNLIMFSWLCFAILAFIILNWKLKQTRFEKESKSLNASNESLPLKVFGNFILSN